MDGSLPTRGAWIEISSAAASGGTTSGRSPHGERGLKLAMLPVLLLTASGRSPHGERGLKSQTFNKKLRISNKSLPTRGAWIEIPTALLASVNSG